MNDQNKLEKDDVSVPFRFALWKLDDLRKQKEVYVQKYGLNASTVKLAQLNEQLAIWQGLASAACPGHQWEDHESDELNPHSLCTICGGVTDITDDMHKKVDAVTLGCHNCQFFVYEPGDLVPYGPGNTQTPDNRYCDHPLMEESESDDSPDRFMHQRYLEEQCVQGGRSCQYWEGKVHK